MREREREREVNSVEFTVRVVAVPSNSSVVRRNPWYASALNTAMLIRPKCRVDLSVQTLEPLSKWSGLQVIGDGGQVDQLTPSHKFGDLNSKSAGHSSSTWLLVVASLVATTRGVNSLQVSTSWLPFPPSLMQWFPSAMRLAPPTALMSCACSKKQDDVMVPQLSLRTLPMDLDVPGTQYITLPQMSVSIPWLVRNQGLDVCGKVTIGDRSMW